MATFFFRRQGLAFYCHVFVYNTVSAAWRGGELQAQRRKMKFSYGTGTEIDV